MEDKFSRTYKFGLFCEGEQVAYARSVREFGNRMKTVMVETPDGDDIPYPVGQEATRFSFEDGIIPVATWFTWFQEAKRDYSKKKMFEVKEENYSDPAFFRWGGGQVISDTSFYIFDCIPEEVFITGYDRERSGFVFQRITVIGKKVTHDDESPSTTEKEIKAVIGDVIIRIPGRMKRTIEGIWRGGDAPGFENDNSNWVRTKGKVVPLDFRLVKDMGIDPETELKKLEALVLKDPDGNAPRQYDFSYGTESWPCVVKKIETEDEALDGEGKLNMVRGTLHLVRRWVATEKTSIEKRELMAYKVSGYHMTLRKIAYEVYKDASLWRAIAAFNPMPMHDGVIIDIGTILTIPSYEVAKLYKTNDYGKFPWLKAA